MSKQYSVDELKFAKAYAKHHNYNITRDLEDYEEYKQVCTLIKAEHSLKSWSEVNTFLKPKSDIKSLLSKYE